MSQLGDDLRTTFRLLRRASPHRALVALALGSLALGALTESAPIALAKVFVDSVLLPDTAPAGGAWHDFLGSVSQFLARNLGRAAGDDPRIPMLALVVLGIVVVGALGALATYANVTLGRVLAARVVADLRCSLLAKVLHLPTEELDEAHRGDLLSRFSNDVQTTHVAINLFVMVLTLQPLVMLVALVAALVLSWQLTLTALLLLPAVLLSIGRLGRSVSRRSRASLESLGESTEAVHQALAGIEVIRVYRAEERELARYRAANDDWIRRQFRLVRAKALGRALTEGSYALAIAAVLWIGGWLVVHESFGMDAASLTAFLVALATLFRPASRVAKAYGDWQESMAAAGRIFEILDRPDPVDPLARSAPAEPNRAALGPLEHALVFEDVSFSYGVGEHANPVLGPLSFTLRRGEIVALTGPSGVGKTTLTELVLGLRSPTRGRILWDGTDLATVPLAARLEQLAWVDQHPFLFRTTIRENLLVAKPDATQEELDRAIEAAHLTKLLQSLPQGYETVVGERGDRFSGGERQRLTIARALLRNASLLVLDEPTSHLDRDSEGAVRDALATLLRGKTAIVVTHDLEAVPAGCRVLDLGEH